MPLVIGGKDVRTGETFDQVMPHDKDHVLATVHKGGATHVEQAIEAAAAGLAGLDRARRGRSARRSSCARPSCLRGPGARR